VARDHRKLDVFHEARRLTLAVDKETRSFPRDERFGEYSSFFPSLESLVRSGEILLSQEESQAKSRKPRA
jgi:hypothetical protein